MRTWEREQLHDDVAGWVSKESPSQMQTISHDLEERYRQAMGRAAHRRATKPPTGSFREADGFHAAVEQEFGVMGDSPDERWEALCSRVEAVLDALALTKQEER